MARPREFDEDTALDAAVGCFWQRGFEATSMRYLATSMGLSAPSLYNTFGDKRALFARALEHYLDHRTRMRLRRLEKALAPKQAIHQFFDEIIERSVDDRERKGCFLVNSALDIAPHDHELGALIAERLGEIEGFFRKCIKGAQADGTAPSGIDAKDVARLFLGVLLGIRVLARSNPNRRLLEGVVKPALALLDSPRNQRKKTR
jgi:TetR/AcrR family transcriptional regulator, transcriptional repressor for nem operon